jgi:hypothetical protein
VTKMQAFQIAEMLQTLRKIQRLSDDNTFSGRTAVAALVKCGHLASAVIAKIETNEFEPI